VVSRWPGSLYRPIRYVRNGAVGTPQGVSIVYTVSLPFTTTSFHYANGRLKGDRGLMFVQASAAGEQMLPVSGAPGGWR
jgi:hypothetical protein